MDSNRDVARVVESWLRTDEHESADRVLSAVLALLDTTPQRRSWWPAPRSADMNTYAKLALAAIAVVAVAVVGFSLRPQGSGVGGGGSTSTQSPSPSPSPVATPSPSPTPVVVFPPAGDLAVGTRHHMTLEGVPFTFTVPTTDWTSNGQFGIDKTAGIGPQGASFILWTDSPVGVFADPCKQQEGPALGTSIDDLADAVAAIPGTDLVSGPTDVTVGGHPAKQVVIRIREDIGCASESFYLWYAPTPDFGRYATATGSTIRTWIIDVDGTPVWIDGETYKGASPSPGQEIQKIVDSIEFE